MADESKLRERMQRIGDLVRRLETAADPAVKLQVHELLQTVLDLHGEAFGRTLERLVVSDATGADVLDAISTDPVVSSVLILHGLHPVSFPARVRAALENARAALRGHGAIAELESGDLPEVRVRVRGVTDAHTARAVRTLLEDELYGAAPDAVSLSLPGLEKFSAPDFVPLESVGVLAAGKAGD